MSRHNDIRDQQINDKKRSRYNREDDEDDGEIREGDVDLDHPGISSKRLRPTATVFESYYDNQNKNVFAVTNEMSGSNKDFIINANNKRSREELERERQIRMAALRGGTDVDTAVVTTTSSMSGITQQSMTTSSTTTHQNNSKHKKKTTSNRTNEDALIDHGKSTKGDIKNDGSEEEGLDDDDDEGRLEEESDDEKMMEAFFGIRQFGSTKNTKVVSNHTSAAMGTVAKHLKPRKYRQYMNRKNGFNRPLDNV